MTSADVRRCAVAMETTLRAARYAYVVVWVLFPVTLVTGAFVGSYTVPVQTAARTSWNTTVMQMVGSVVFLPLPERNILIDCFLKIHIHIHITRARLCMYLCTIHVEKIKPYTYDLNAIFTFYRII